MMSEAHSNLQMVKDFLKAIENRTGFDELAKFYHPDSAFTLFIDFVFLYYGN